MEKVSGHTNLYRRGAVYYYRSRVPKDLIEHVPFKEFKFSLQTKDYQDALVKVKERAYLVQKEIEGIRSNIALSFRPAVSEINVEQLSHIKQAYLSHLLEEDEDTRLTGFYRGKQTPTPVPTFEEHKESNEDLKHYTQSKYAQGITNAHFEDEALEVSRWSGISLNIKANSVAHKRIARCLQEATIEAAEAIAQRNEGKIIATPVAPQATNSNTSAPLLSSVMEDWIQEKSRTAWRPSTEKSHRTWAEYFIEMLGDKPITEYSKADARIFKQTLLDLPANWKKHSALKDLKHIQEAAMKAQELHLEPRAMKTVKENINRVSSLWQWASENYDEVEKNIFIGIKVKDTANRQDARHPFTLDDLKTIFSSPIYTGCLSERKTLLSGSHSMKHSVKYWAPLISLYSGMRLAEITGLYATDIVINPNGISYFDLKEDTQRDRQLKTTRSTRKVPIHKALICAGFIEYVADKQKKPNVTFLFPDVDSADYSDKYTKQFSRLLVSTEVKTPKKTFHSFRHNFQDACREANVPPEIRETLAGREASSSGVSGVYGDGYSIEILNEWLQKIDYKDFDFKELKQI